MPIPPPGGSPGDPWRGGLSVVRPPDQDHGAHVELRRREGCSTGSARPLRHGDLALALGVIGILVVLILPMPRLLLDLLLAVSITFSVLILLTSLFIEKPLEFSAFPTVLLIATMLRLALNLASTRLILAEGHQGSWAAGHVIEAFGSFIMQGNFVIGLIVFAILVIVNFVVITKGSGRIAEVVGALLAGRHARQADGDRRRSVGRADRRAAKRASAAAGWRRRAASSAPWTAPPSSCAATPSPAC